MTTARVRSHESGLVSLGLVSPQQEGARHQQAQPDEYQKGSDHDRYYLRGRIPPPCSAITMRGRYPKVPALKRRDMGMRVREQSLERPTYPGRHRLDGHGCDASLSHRARRVARVGRFVQPRIEVTVLLD